MQGQNVNSHYSRAEHLSKKYKVGIVGATGMVGQQLIRILQDHPWFEVMTLAASSASAGKSYGEAVGSRWCMDIAIPDRVKNVVVKDAGDVAAVAEGLDIVFTAVSAGKQEVLQMEDAYAQAGLWVTSCNSAYRMDPLVPMMIPAVNSHHLQVIDQQRKDRGYEKGAIIVKSNCSIQSYVIALTPLLDFGIKRIYVHSSQAISGAGKTFAMWPEMIENLIPLISGEEEKSELEPLKIWGETGVDGIQLAAAPRIKAKCVRVAVQDGHTAFVRVQFENKVPNVEQILQRWEDFETCQGLPSAPLKFIHYRPEGDRPQPKLDVMTENGMVVTIGQLKVDDEDGISFTALTHNTILGAAGGAVLATELAVSKGLVHQHSAVAGAVS